jgi:hypothetical protein
MTHPLPRPFVRAFCLISTVWCAVSLNALALVAPEGERPAQMDVRGPDGVPKGTDLRQPSEEQLKAIGSLESLAGAPLVIQYNGLTATPRHLFSHSGYLTPPSAAQPEVIAREFLNRWRGIWRFSDDDLQNLRLRSRATLADTGTTVLLFEQHVDGVGVYKGEVLVNVNQAGQIISVGNESFPQMTVTNSFALSPARLSPPLQRELGSQAFRRRRKAPRTSCAHTVICRTKRWKARVQRRRGVQR